MDDDPTVIANAVHRSDEIILTTSGVPEGAVHPLARVRFRALRHPERRGIRSGGAGGLEKERKVADETSRTAHPYP